MEYKELRFIIESPQKLRIIKPNGISFSVGIPLSQDTLKVELINILHDWLAVGKITRRRELIALGSLLYQGLFDDRTNDIFMEEWTKTQKQPTAVLRLILEFEQEARILAALPWEYLYHPDSEREKGFFLATRRRLVLSRQVPLNEEVQSEPVGDLYLRILLVISTPEQEQDGTELGVVKAAPTIATIEQLVQQFPTTVRLMQLREPTKRRLFELVSSFRPDVVHFIGHGRYDGEKGALALVHENDPKTASWISDADLADCFIDYQPRFVFLESCEGARSSSYEAFRGVALQLAYSRTPAVLAMQYEIENKVANRFSQVFYQSLVQGKPLDVAVQDGRYELAFYLEEQNFSSRAFGSPVVFVQRGADTTLINVSGDLS